MPRFYAPVLLLALSACANSNLRNDLALDLEDADAVIAGEFIIDAEVPLQVAADIGLTRLDFDAQLGAGLYKTDEGVSRAALEATLKDHFRGGLQIENNRPVQALANDPYQWIQWNMELMDIETAWDHSTGAGAVVAVIDSGVSWSGEDRPVNLVAGWDYVDNDGDPSDENGHGTHVAGTIAQATDNGRGVVGMAPDATVLVYRVLDRWGSGSTYWSAKAITAAADNGADVINLSLGSRYSSSTEATAVAYAASQGVVIVAASGNDGRSSIDYPGAYSETIAVGAIRADLSVTDYSNGGSGLDLVAPGGDSGVDQNGDGYGDGILQETITGYEFFDGTSMATPHVAGLAALLISAGADSNDVRDILVNTADDLGSNGWDTWSGHGLINPVAALSSVSAPSNGGTDPEPEPEPEADTTAPTISNVSGWRSGTSLTLTWTTDEPATSEIEFEGYGVYGDDSNYVTDHEQNFTISAGATYYFTLISVDEAGNETTDGQWVTRP